MKYWVWIFSCIGFTLTAQSQVQLQIVRPRVNYLLYEPIVLEIVVKNESGKTLKFQEQGGQSWLRFLVKRSNGLLARQARDFSLPPLILEPGDMAKFKFDLVPYYQIREIDSYEVSAVLQSPDGEGDLISPKVVFSVIKGRAIWSEQRGMPGSNERRTFSLIANLIEDRVTLYAQIESEDNNSVLMCKPLGFLMSGQDPETEIEEGKKWHILFRTGAEQFRYFEFGVDGEMLHQEDYASIETRPRLVNVDGVFRVIGGVNAEQMRGETLSEAQPAAVTRPGG
ncbi:MAG: hypothetical protein R3F23_01315 [Verrucomicrobiia bacterium]